MVINSTNANIDFADEHLALCDECRRPDRHAEAFHIRKLWRVACGNCQSVKSPQVKTRHNSFVPHDFGPKSKTCKEEFSTAIFHAHLRFCRCCLYRFTMNVEPDARLRCIFVCFGIMFHFLGMMRRRSWIIRFCLTIWMHGTMMIGNSALMTDRIRSECLSWENNRAHRGYERAIMEHRQLLFPLTDSSSHPRFKQMCAYMSL